MSLPSTGFEGFDLASKSANVKVSADYVLVPDTKTHLLGSQGCFGSLVIMSFLFGECSFFSPVLAGNISYWFWMRLSKRSSGVDLDRRGRSYILDVLRFYVRLSILDPNETSAPRNRRCMRIWASDCIRAAEIPGGNALVSHLQKQFVNVRFWGAP